MKELVKKMRQINREIDRNIFTSMNNVNLNCVLGTKKNGEYIKVSWMNIMKNK